MGGLNLSLAHGRKVYATIALAVAVAVLVLTLPAKPVDQGPPSEGCLQGLYSCPVPAEVSISFYYFHVGGCMQGSRYYFSWYVYEYGC